MSMTVGAGMDEEPRCAALVNASGAWHHPPVRAQTALLGGLALAACVALPAHAAPARDGPVRARAAQCVDGVQRGDTYMPAMDVTLHGTLPPVVARRRALVPPCGDTLPSPAVPDTPSPVVLYQRRGIPASVALFGSASRRRGSVHLYLAAGTYPQQRDHPLHRYFYASRRRPDAVKGRRCRPRTVTALVPSFDGLMATRGGRLVHVRVDASTRITGPRVDGVPRLTYGERVRVRAVDCGGHVGLVARVVSPRG
jgi:hypothetical protein